LTAVLVALLAGAGAAWAFWQLARVRLHAHDLGITHAYAWPTYAATAVLIALLVQNIWRVGTAVWLSELWAFPACAKAPHVDTSACGAVTPDSLS
jgi:hypothetical protein